MEFLGRVLVLGATALALEAGAGAGAGITPASARVLLTRDQAIAQIYGAGARAQARTAYLTDAQVEAVKRAARAPFDAHRVTYYEIARGDTALGLAFVDQNVVRTQTETLLIALDPAGAIRAIEVLAWNEPDDFRPPGRWLDRARGQASATTLEPGKSLPHLAGATLSGRAVAACGRRALALAALVTRAENHP
ncbi:MAG TPA: FMN-binding protein [Candidatus Eisenbacteria bacterium]|nr:FMN-binding protein [Candidatus Eisenbacteria bacterium]